VCGSNPWNGVDLPRVDKKDPRVLTDAEEMKFLTWLENRYEGWRLPVLWFLVKGFVGSRSADITGLRSEQLRDGRIYFPAEEAKGREDRPAILPPALFAELRAAAGPIFVFESFHAGLVDYYRRANRRGGRHSMNFCKSFNPKRMVGFLQSITG
jgi:integrase